MAINAVGSGTNTVPQVNNAAAERRLEEQRQLRQDEQRIREQQQARTERANTQQQETRRTEQAQAAAAQDFLTRQQLLAQNANANRNNPGTPAPGSIIQVTA